MDSGLFEVSTSSIEETNKAVDLVKRECQRDIKEKLELHQLNDRFSFFLVNIDQLKNCNEKLENDLRNEFLRWGKIQRDDETLEKIVEQIAEKSKEKTSSEVNVRTKDETVGQINRLSNVFQTINELEVRKRENLQSKVEQLSNELSRVENDEKLSENDLETVRNELNNETKKFSSRLDDWRKVLLDKQILIDEIQSMRERRNFLSALNEEEINEWKRLLEESTGGAIEFYREELSNAVRDLKRDYSKQIKFVQQQIEREIERDIDNIESQIEQTSIENSTNFDADRAEEENSKFVEQLQLFDDEQTRFNQLNKIVAEKRRILRDQEIQLDQIRRKIVDKQNQERNQAEKLQREYRDLHGYLQQIAFRLTFSVEDELRIYSCLLNDFTHKNESESFSNRIQFGPTESEENFFDENFETNAFLRHFPSSTN